MAKNKSLNAFRPRLVSLAVASCFTAGTALANPTNPTVVNGAANFANPAANVLNVTTATPQTIINWGSFSINANELTKFLQPSAASAVLNRVAAGNPSQILGALQSNGRVFIVNPSGITFGAGAQVDVAGLIATSLNLSNADFLAGKLKFTDGASAGSVVNQGNITTGSGGEVYLVGNAVTNNGIITSPNGTVVLAAGNSVELVNPGTPNLRVEIAAAENQARNLGQIIADSGRIGIYAGLVNQSGTIRADRVSLTDDGRIVLVATKNATLEAGSVTAASGAAGGSVTVQSGDTTLVSGTVEAKGASGQGGSIQILGDKVGVFSGALVDASGNTGGGTVLVGGDFQGKNPDIQNASMTYLGSGATLRADAGQSGDGGKVIVWADDTTRAYGTITARGGAQSGDGGFVEVSGKQSLDFNAGVNTIASNGKTGTLLLDPTTINIVDTVPGVDLGAGGNPFIAGAIGDQLSVTAIELAGQTTSVFIQATNSITISKLVSNPTIDITYPGASITINSTTGSQIHFDSPSTNGIVTNGGAITLTATNTSSLNSIGSLTSNGGTITLVGQAGVSIGAGATIDAGAGDLIIRANDVVKLTDATKISGANAQFSTYVSGQLKVNTTGVADGTNFVTTPADLAKISLTTPASGALTLLAYGGGNLELNAPVTIDPAKAETLMLSRRGSNTAQIIQNVSAPLSVKKLAIDGGEGGNLSMLAPNLVGILSYNSPNSIFAAPTSFGFNNAQSLEIGSAGGINGFSLTQSSSSSGDAAVNIGVTGNLNVTQGITVTGAAGSPTGRGAALTLSATGTFNVTDNNINVNGGTGTIDKGTASATISGQGGVTLTSASVGANGGASAAVAITSSGGNVQLGDGGVSAVAGFNSGNTATVAINAPSGSIQQASGGQLQVGGNTTSITLNARDGIGTIAAPINVSRPFSQVQAFNTGAGATGDIALQFDESVQIFGTSNIQNANPTGTYYLQSNQGEGSFISLSVPFLPGGSALQPGQNVYFKATGSNGQIALLGPSSGSISGAAKVTLEAQNNINMQGSTSISAGDVVLRSDNMDIQGTVTAVNNIYVTPMTAGRTIDLGGLSSPGTTLALNTSELAMFTAPGLGIGTDGTTANTGPITITSAVGPFNAFPNLFGNNITQNSGATINSLGGLNAFSTGGIVLAEAGNNIGSFGGTAGTSINVVTTGNLALGAVTAGSSASFTSSGGAILNTSGLANITSPSVSLTAATGIGSGIPIMLTNASPTGVTAINTTSGGIGLLQTNGTFTVGAGGWNVQNAPGGEIIIEGLNVTLGTGAPNSGPLEIFASNQAIVGPGGYASTNAVTLSGGNTVNVNGNLSAGDLILVGINEVNINGAIAQGNTASVIAGKLNVKGTSTPGALRATTDLGVIAGEINVTGGTSTGAFAEIKAGPGSFFMEVLASPSTTGNINLKGGSGSGAYARIFGDPDVGTLLLPVSVGGVINMDAGSGTGAYARIESASVNSIHVDFTNAASGGFFVNGVENALSSGDSGFFAGGQPAVAGQNFFASYGSTPLVISAFEELPPVVQSGVQQAINQVVVATNQQTTTLTDTNTSGDSEGGTGAGTTATTDEKPQKKALPICGK